MPADPYTLAAARQCGAARGEGPCAIHPAGFPHAASRRTFAAGQDQRIRLQLHAVAAVSHFTHGEMGRAWPERRDPALSRRGYLELLRAVLADPGRQAGGGDRRVLDPGGLANIIESKSFKLYLNSLNQSAFDSRGRFARYCRKTSRPLPGARGRGACAASTRLPRRASSVCRGAASTS